MGSNSSHFYVLINSFFIYLSNSVGSIQQIFNPKQKVLESWETQDYCRRQKKRRNSEAQVKEKYIRKLESNKFLGWPDINLMIVLVVRLFKGLVANMGKIENIYDSSIEVFLEAHYFCIWVALYDVNHLVLDSVVHSCG
jgi:hypothetical protein